MRKILGFVYRTPSGGTFIVKAFDRNIADAVAQACYKEFTFSYIDERPL